MKKRSLRSEKWFNNKEDPGSMTSFGHACTFADYANIPVNSPSLFKTIPTMLLKSNGPLSVDLFYILKNLPWAFRFLSNCRKDKVEQIAGSLADLLQHSRLSYDNIFQHPKMGIRSSKYTSHRVCF